MKFSLASIKKIVAKIFLLKFYLLIAAAAAFIFLLLYVQSGDFERRLSRYIIRKIENQFDRKAALDRVGFSFFPLEVVIENIAISDEQGQFEQPFFASKDCLVKLKLSQLFRKSLDFKEIRFTRPVINLRFDEQGKLIFPLPKRKSGTGESSFSTSIAHVALNNGLIGVDNKKIPLDLQFSELKVQVAKKKQGHEGSIAFSDSFVKYKDYARTRLLEVDLSFAVQEGRVTFPNILVRNPGIETTVQGTLNLNGPVTYLFDIQSSMFAQNVKEIFNVAQSFTGKIDFLGQVEGVGKAHKLTGEFLGNPRLFDRIQVHQLTGRALWTPDEITFHDMNCTALDGNVSGSFTTFKEQGHRILKADVDFHSIDVEKILEDVRIKGFKFAGRADGKGEIQWKKGSLIDMTGKGTIRLKPPERSPAGLNDPIPLDTDLAFTVDGRAFHFENSRVFFKDTDILFNGSLGLDHPSDLDVRTHTRSLEEVDRFIRQIRLFRSEDMNREIDLLGMKGAFDFVGTYFGEIKEPAVRGLFEGKNIVYADSEWGQVNGNLVLDNAFLSFSDTRISGLDGTIDVEGYFKVYRRDRYSPGEIDASFILSQFPVPGLFRIFNQEVPLTGRVSGRARLEGYYGALLGEAQITMDSGRFLFIPFGELATDVVFTPPKVVFTRGDAEIGGGRIRTTGELDYNNKTMDLTCLGDRMDISSLPGVKNLNTGGMASFNAFIAGRISRPDVRIESFRVDDLSMAGNPLPAIEGEGSLHQAAGQYQLEFVDQTLICRGTLKAEKNLLLEGELLLNQCNLTPLLMEVTGFLNLEEMISGKIAFVLPALEPEKFRATAFIETMDTTIADYRLQNHKPVMVSLEEGLLLIDQASFTGDNSLFSIYGTVDTRQEARLDLKLHGDFNLSLLKLFSSSITTRGSLSLEAELGGFAGNPILSGEAIVEEGYFLYKDFAHPIRNMEADLKLSTRQIEVVSCTCQFGGGTLTASGNWLISGNSPNSFNFDINCRDVTMKYPTDVTSTFNADCSLRGDLEGQLLSGDIRVDELLYNAEFSSASILGNGEARGDELAAVNKFRNNFKFNLNIEADDGLMVDNNLADLELLGSLALQGTLEDPIIFGHTSVLDGEIYFQNVEFKLQKGNIDFQDPRQINPVLDLVASSLINNTYDITLTFYGPLDKLRFSYSSNPPLSEVEIISLLATGRIREGRERVQDLATVGVSSFLTDQFLGGVSQGAARLFGFDRFAIEPSLAGEETRPTAWLTVKKQFPHNFSVTYSYNFTRQEESIILIEYQLTENLVLVGTKDKDGSRGFDINYRLSY